MASPADAGDRAPATGARNIYKTVPNLIIISQKAPDLDHDPNIFR